MRAGRLALAVVAAAMMAAGLGCDFLTEGEDSRGEDSCTPECSGRECGGDGCGGSCGNCSSGQSCVSGVCEEGESACEPECSGKQCGDDGCGGVCGGCGEGQVCDYLDQCVSADQGTVDGDLFFEARVPTVDDNGSIVLDQVSEFPGAGMLAMVFDVQGNVVGGAQVDDQGHFTVPLSRPPSEDDTLLFVTVWAPSLQSDIAPLAVGQSDAGGQAAPGNIVPWAWQVATPPDGYVGSVTITEDQGSGAIYLFLFTKLAMQTILWDILGGDESGLATLAIVWTPGLAWDCGACFGKGFTQNMDGTVFDNSIFISGEASDSSAWGWAVILHEFGHYVARNYSRDDSPGGSHSLGVPVVPPFAWSEGWASFFAVSTMSRWFGEAVPLYWDIQQGSSFWVDYAQMTSSGDMVAPDPDGGMEQSLDENWVAAALWDLWDGNDVPETESPQDGTALGTEVVIAAVATPRFLGGDRGATGADLVDFVDSVVCGAPSLAESVVGTLIEHLGFPYEGEPDCGN